MKSVSGSSSVTTAVSLQHDKTNLVPSTIDDMKLAYAHTANLLQLDETRQEKRVLYKEI